MASEEECFPRGGPDKKTTSTKQKNVFEVDNLFGNHKTFFIDKKKPANQFAEKKKETTKKHEQELTVDKTIKVEVLHSRNVKVGTLMLGCVKQVTDIEAVVALPSGLVGFLPISNICDHFSEMINKRLETDDNLEDVSMLRDILSPGMLIRCIVLSFGSNKEDKLSLKLSINPKEVNKALTPAALKAGMVLSGCVESVEDHGVLIDIGVAASKAFLPKKSMSSNTEPALGQYVTVVIEDVKNNGRVVRLSQNPQTIQSAVATLKHCWSINTLLPGLLVSAQIKRVTSHGLIVTFLSFTGVVDFLHLDVDKAMNYSAGEQVLGRVLHVEPSTGLVALTLRKHLLPPGGSELEHLITERFGQVVSNCKMTALHYSSGAMMETPDCTAVFVHKNLLKESKDEYDPNSLLSKPEHTLRMLDYSPMEQIHLGSLRRSTVEMSLFSYKEITVGQVLQGVVIGFEKQGLGLKITEYIKGFVPKLHLADIELRNPEKKFFKGMSIKCRVLSVNPEDKSLFLTLKKTLVESTLPIFKTFSDAQVGLVSHGVIVSVKEYGCFVRFYEKVTGLVQTKELSAKCLVHPESCFQSGQVIKVKVIGVNIDKQWLRLSARAVTEEDVIQEQTAMFDFETGKVVDVKVLRKVPDGLEVSIIPEETPAFLPTLHLSDHVTNCVPLWSAVDEGDTISNVACLVKNKRGIILTKKPTLKAYLEGVDVPKDFSGLQVGQQMVGWVKNFMTYGAFVDFPHKLFGLAPKANMSDQFVTETTGIFESGQTVIAKVTNLDEEKGRFLVSLKASDVSLYEDDVQARMTQGLLERRSILEMMASRADSDVLHQLSALSVGDVMNVTVGDSTDDGTVTLNSDQLKNATLLASKHHTEGVNLTPGCKVKAVVLHVDPQQTQVHVSLLPKLTTKKKTLVIGKQLSAEVLYSDKDFAVVSLDDTGHMTIIPTLTHVNNILESKKFTVGFKLRVVVKERSCEKINNLPLVTFQRLDRLAQTRSLVPLGEEVTVKVKKVKPLEVLVELPTGTIGRIPVSEIQESPVPGSFPTSTLKIGTEVTARVFGGHTIRANRFLPISHPNFKLSRPDLTLLQRKSSDTFRSYKPGDDVMCFPGQYLKALQCLEVHVKSNVVGSVDLLSFIRNPEQIKCVKKLFKPGQAVSAKVVGVSRHRFSQLALSFTGEYKLDPGMVTLAIVRKIDPQLGLLLKLPFENSAFALVTDLSDSYTNNPLEAYKEGQVVRCRVLERNQDSFHVSLRPSRLQNVVKNNITDPEIQSISDLEKGQILRGFVKAVGNQGVFVRLSSAVIGRVLFHNATKYYIDQLKNVSEYIQPNTLLTAKVLSVDVEKQHVDLSLLSEDTGEPDIIPESLNFKIRWKKNENEDAKKRKRDASVSQKDEQEQKTKKLKPSVEKTNKKLKPCVETSNSGKVIGTKKRKKQKKIEDSDSGVEVFFREDDETESSKTTKQNKQKCPDRLQVPLSFPWESTLSTLAPASLGNREEEPSDDEQDVKNVPVKKSRKELQQQQKEAEQQLSAREAELMDTSARPDSAVAFERLLLSSPDSSLLWLQYMAFHLQATQMEQARSVAERALKTISFREEQEKLNVWVAMLNLENMYGTPETLHKVFERAVQYCEPLPVYQQLANIYAKSSKTDEAEKLYKTMVKRFRQEKSVYVSYGSFLLEQRQSDSATALLQKALQSLATRDHVDLISRFARMEFQYGNKEKGKTMFEQVLATYPKRTDLWSVFIDLMEKHGSQKDVREIFDRAIHLSVSVKKIKFFFKRYLEYEKKKGTAESIQAVKQKALEYVEAKGGDAS